MGMRKKLIELLACAEDSLLEQAVAWDDEQKEEHIADGDGYGFYADHLIANDVVPVVRCKDCIESAEYSLGRFCECGGYYVNDDFYCANGERK